MRRMLTIVTVSVALVGCSKAVASQPDGRNPAHCVAALNYANYWLKKGGKHQREVAQGVARMLFETSRIKASGQSLGDAHDAGVALTKAYGNNRDKMNSLLWQCLTAEDADPEFHRQMPALLVQAQALPYTTE